MVRGRLVDIEAVVLVLAYAETALQVKPAEGVEGVAESTVEGDTVIHLYV